MKTHQFIVALAATVAMAMVPQLALASCTGDACNFISYDGKAITNKDPQLKIQVSGCIIDDALTACRSNATTFGFTIDPKANQPIIWSGHSGYIKLDIQKATFIGSRPVLGPDLMKKVSVTNGGSVPLKVVILDAGFADIGRTPDYKTGSFDVTLKKGVAKYLWEVFMPGAVEPCQKKRDETKDTITVQCQAANVPAKVPDAAHMPVTRPVTETSGAQWAENCKVKDASFSVMEACCTRHRTAEPYCMQDPQHPPKDCAAAELLCQQSVRTWTGRRDANGALLTPK
jgi:hypothetical protein